ncbi:MAG: hypothetical protein LJE67_13885 [Salaquimonas sp.]|nr:hypothetical protein [Salaquimonas sp.]
MQRLVDNELIYGRLWPVTEPHLVARYNQALEGFGLKRVELDAFNIDMAGFSTEVAEVLGDTQYLDPHGVNRRFIILTPEQIDLPVINTAFSNTEDLLYQFFEKNSREIFALTIKDVLYGEIEDNVFEVHDIEDLLSIEQVEFRVFTASNLLAKTNELQLLIERLQKKPDAWQDDAMLGRMVELARQTGDIRENALLPHSVVFRQSTFWTSHFGGVYIFIDDKQVTVICDPSAKGFRKSRPWQVSYIARDDHERVYDFLAETGRIDPPRGSWIERSGLLAERSQMLVVWLAMQADPKVDLSRVNPQWASSWVARNPSAAERGGMLALLNHVQRQVTNWSNLEMRELRPTDRFLVSRANPDHPDFYLVNRLISEYLPFDYMTRFVFNKPRFYRDYETWPENYRDYVVKQIRDNYLANKKALRRRLYK